MPCLSTLLPLFLSKPGYFCPNSCLTLEGQELLSLSQETDQLRLSWGDGIGHPWSRDSSDHFMFGQRFKSLGTELIVAQK